MLIQWKDNKKGISIIEILVVIAIIVIALVSILGLATFALRVSTLMKETAQANNLAQEIIETVRNFRDGTDWDTNGLGNLTIGVNYYPRKTADIPPKWELVLGEETVDAFTRKVVFENVSRDLNDNIEGIYNPINDDPKTRKVIAVISWKDKEVEIITYLTDW